MKEPLVMQELLYLRVLNLHLDMAFLLSIKI